MNTKARLADKLFWRLKTVEHNLLKQSLARKETVVVDTEYGKIKGAKRMSVYERPYNSFEGIPYAKPPIGALRFKAPEIPAPWADIKDCTDTKNKSTQIHFMYNKVEGSEDCLYLNVYTNNMNPSKPRPVMVWIHGGGFILGEANRDWYGPDYFMNKDVVLVTIQYRLGVLGFLSLNSPGLNVPGNAGLKDQVMALKWVKSNCTAFGGDPNCITVFGESAGGASTHYMSLTEQTKGLFHRHILMSGNSMGPWALNDCANRAFTLADATGYKNEKDEKKLLEHLSSAKGEDLIKHDMRTLKPEERHKVMFAFGPVIEPYLTPECVIPKHPREMMKTGWGNALPMLAGNTSYEGLLFKSETTHFPEIVNDLNSCVDFVPAEIADPARTSPETIQHGLTIKRAHVNGEKPTEEDYFDLCSHIYFWFPTQRVFLSRFANSTAPTYLYRFDFDSEELMNPYRLMRYGRGSKGVSHADELSYLFWNLLAQKLPETSREYRTIERTVGIWTQFAATGNPNNAKIDGMENINWGPLNKTDAVHKCLNISDELKVIDLPEMEKIKAWQSCFDKKQELLY